jgi:hypothetical protein
VGRTGNILPSNSLLATGAETAMNEYLDALIKALEAEADEQL